LLPPGPSRRPAAGLRRGVLPAASATAPAVFLPRAFPDSTGPRQRTRLLRIRMIGGLILGSRWREYRRTGTRLGRRWVRRLTHRLYQRLAIRLRIVGPPTRPGLARWGTVVGPSGRRYAIIGSYDGQAPVCDVRDGRVSHAGHAAAVSSRDG